MKKVMIGITLVSLIDIIPVGGRIKLTEIAVSGKIENCTVRSDVVPFSSLQTSPIVLDYA